MVVLTPEQVAAIASAEAVVAAESSSSAAVAAAAAAAASESSLKAQVAAVTTNDGNAVASSSLSPSTAVHTSAAGAITTSKAASVVMSSSVSSRIASAVVSSYSVSSQANGTTILGSSSVAASSSFYVSSSHTASSAASPVISSSLARSSASSSTSLAAGNNSATNGDGNNSAPLTSSALIAIAVAGTIFIVGVATSCWICRRRRRRRAINSLGNGGDDDDISGALPRIDRRTRAGYTRGTTQNPRSDLLPTRIARDRDLTRAEAVASVVLPYSPYMARGLNDGTDPILPPRRPNAGGFFDAPSDRPTSSAWTDNSEMDMFAVDGSSIARTLSTASVGSAVNSEYDLGNDPGSTVTWGGRTPGVGGGTYMSSATTPTFFAEQRRLPHLMVDTKSPTASGPSQAQEYESYFGLDSTSSSSPISTQRSAPPPTFLTGSSAVSPLMRSGTGGASTYVSHAPTLRTPTDGFSTSTFSSNAVPRRVDPFGDPTSSGAPSPMSYTSPASYTGHSFARPLVHPHHHLRDRPAPPLDLTPSALPYDRPSTSPTLASSRETTLRRGPTVIRHADAGLAFADAEPDADASGELHLPPAYGDIYGPR